MAARPPYAVTHEGPVLICGPAPTLYRDFRAARALYPEAALFAVSWAIRAVRAAHVLSNHYEKAAELRALAAHDWPGHAFTLHSQPPMQRADIGKTFPAVDHFWEEAAACSNSAVAAARVALAMGYGPAIFCGVALDGTTGYAFDTGSACFWEPASPPMPASW
ncbi:MAG: hypothetical protein WDM81_13915 [Rhizomicrobium sp.]